MYQRAIWWIKRDLRLRDNPALAWCIEHARDVVPVFVWESSVIEGPDASPMQQNFWLPALSALRDELRRLESDITVLYGELPDVFAHLQTRLPFDALCAEEETGLSHTFARDRRVRAWCREHGIALVETPRNGVIRGLTDRDARIRIWKSRVHTVPLDAPPRLTSSAEARRLARATRLPPPGQPSVQHCTEAAAHSTLQSFLARRAGDYRAGLSGMNSAPVACSRLSVHLAWGTISLRSVFAAVTKRQEELRALAPAERNREAPGVLSGLAAFASRLHWHDHFIQRLEREPQIEFHSINRAYDDIEFEDDPELLQRWLSGTTGFLYADAAMRCLRATGWVNFRSRAMLVSLAVHVLHLSWRTILYPLAQLMGDYLPGIHVSQTQMQAGMTGINTLRVYNPHKQLTDHDPDAWFVRRWIPELSDQSAADIVSGAVPVRPVVDYQTRSAAMKRAIFAVRRSPAGRAEAERVLALHGSRRRPTRR